MPNPYNIAEVDVPGILNAFEAGRTNRVRSMQLRMQMDAAERQAEREQSFRDVLARAYGTEAGRAQQGGASSSSNPASAAPAAPTPAPGTEVNSVVAAYGGAAGPENPMAPAAAPVAAAPAAPRAQGLTPEIMQQLVAIDPEQANQIFTAVRNMDQAQAGRLAMAQGALGQLGEFLLTEVPEAEWAAEIQRRAPDLQAHGVTPEQIASFQPTRRNVQFAVNQARDIEKVIEDARPDLHENNGQIIDYNALPAATPGNPVVYTDPILNTGAGPYLRADVMGAAGGAEAPPQPGEVRQTSRGPMRFRGGNYRDPNNYEPVQGGQSQPGSGNFPRRSGTLTIDRNHNPGALRVPGSTRFQSFSSPAEGVRAQEAQLRRYHNRGLRTVRDVVETYAPRESRGGDNTDAQVNNYIAHVSRRLGVSPGQPIPADRIPEMAEAMRGFETGRR